MPTTQYDYYEILGVSKNSSPQEIKQSYLKLAKELHPDVNSSSSAEEEFKAVGEAYEVLSDPEKREIYDRYGHDGLSGLGGFGHMDPMDLFSSIFGSSLFGQSRGPSAPPPGADREVLLNISFEESVFGVSKEIKLKSYKFCEECEASGASPGTSPAQCIDCEGKGQIGEVRQTFLLGQTMTLRACSRCQGTGKYLPSPCDICKGSGRLMEERLLEIKVPGGVENDSILRMRGSGDAGSRGGQAGDLYVILKVSDHPDYRRVDEDLIKDVKISMYQAVLGGNLEIETLDGTQSLEVKPGTSHGAVQNFKGLGVVRRDGKKRGNLIVHFIVETPKHLSKQERRLLEDAAKLHGEDVG